MMKRLTLSLLVLMLSLPSFYTPTVQAAPSTSPFLGVWEGIVPWDGTTTTVVLWKTGPGINMKMTNWYSADCAIIVAKGKGYTGGDYTLDMLVRFYCIIGPRQNSTGTLWTTFEYDPVWDVLEWEPYGIILHRK